MNNPLIQAAAAEWWAMNQKHMNFLLETAMAFDISTLTTAAMEMTQSGDDINLDKTPVYEVTNGVAIINIHGTILKTVPRLWRLCDCNATGCDEIRDSVISAVQNPEVKQIVLHVDSPGGTVSGVQETGDVIFQARSFKPVHAIVEDLAASAGYWFAAQASTISANLTAHIGSIGVYTVCVDNSRAYANEGFDAKLVASGLHKGAGASGVAITPDQIAQIQENVEDLADIFKAAVCQGRCVGMDTVGQWTSGRTWIAHRALALGLIDFIENQDEALERISNINQA